MDADRIRPQVVADLVSRWRDFHNSVNFIPDDDHSEFQVSEFILVEWFSGRESSWERGFWVSFDGSDVVHRVINVVPSWQSVQGREVMTVLRIETDDGFGISLYVDPITRGEA